MFWQILLLAFPSTVMLDAVKPTAGQTEPTTPKAYHTGCEKAVNQLIRGQLSVSYIYVAMAMRCDRADINLPGFKAMFMKASEYKWNNAVKLMEYQNNRQADIKFTHLPKPAKESFKSGLEAMKETLKIEEKLNRDILEVYQLARQHNDAHLQHFTQAELLSIKPATIKEVVGYITRINKLGGALGEVQLDKDLAVSYSHKPKSEPCTAKDSSSEEK